MIYLIAIGMPCLVLMMSLAWRFASGPFWLGINSDGPYNYLVNSLYLADHRVPVYVQHPGTPLQMIGAVIIKALNLFVPDSRMVENVLKAPEFYLHVMYAALIIFYIVTLMAAAFYAYRHSRDWFFALLVQTPALLYLTMCNGSGVLIMPANVCAETLLLGFLNLYGICLLRAFFIEDKKALVWTALGWGVVYGVLVATKFTSLPLIVLPLVLIPSLRARLFFCVMAAGSFVMATMPIWPRYSLMWENLHQMLTHTGSRGTGPQGFINWGSFGNGLAAILSQHWLLMSSVLLVLGIILFKSVTLRSWNKLNKSSRWAACIAGTIILQFLMVAKEPQDYYMVPAMGLFGFLWAFMYRSGGGKPLVWRVAALFFIGTSLVCSFIYLGNFHKTSSSMRSFSEEVYSRYSGIVCGYYRSSSLPFAVAFGEDSYGLKVYGDEIQRLYPNECAMDIWQFKIDNPAGNFIEDALARGRHVFLYGSALPESFFSPMFKVKLLDQRGSEAVYGVLEANDKKGFQLFYMAETALIQGQPQIAYALGSRAKSFGVPAARDLMARMNQILEKSSAK